MAQQFQGKVALLAPPRLWSPGTRSAASALRKKWPKP